MREETLGDLVTAYEQAIREKRDRFTFQGKELLTDFAKYMIEYYRDMRHLKLNQRIKLEEVV